MGGSGAHAKISSMTTASPAPASAPLLQRLAAGDCLWVIATDTEVQALLRAGHAYIAATLPHRAEMVTLAITEEGRSATYTQRAFFRNLDDAETAKDAQATREAVQRKPDEEFRALLRKHLYAVNDGFIVPCILDMSAAWETIAKGVNAAPYDHEKVAERVMALISATRDGFTEALQLARIAHPEQRDQAVLDAAAAQSTADQAVLCAALMTYAKGDVDTQRAAVSP